MAAMIAAMPYMTAEIERMITAAASIFPTVPASLLFIFPTTFKLIFGLNFINALLLSFG